MVTCVPLLALAAANSRPATAAADAVELAASIATLSISINGAPEPGVAYVIRNPGGLLVDTDTLTRLRLAYRESVVVEVEGRAYLPLETIPGIHWSISAPEQRLDLVIDAALLPASRLRYELPEPPLPQTPAWGGFLNYNLFGYSNVGGASFAASSSALSAAFEAVAFGPSGTGGASFIVNPTQASRAGTDKIVLLNAGWRWDDPEKLRTLIVGDAITAPGWWGNAVRFGGVQYSSNFALQPGYVTYPLLTVIGISTVPTAAEIYSNNVRMGTQNLPPGPFSITNVPALSGAGELQVVVTNAFGQQQVITQPFYVTSQLLKPGLSEFSFSAGSERFNYGVRTANYEGFIGSGFYRYGVTDKLTVQGRAEADNHVRGIGAGADYVVGYLGVLSTGVAASSASGDIVGASGTGGRALLGFSRQGSLSSFSVQSTWASPNYREIGDSPLQLSRWTTATFSVALPAEAGSLSVAWTGQRYRDTAPPDPLTPVRSGPLNIATAGYSVGLGRFGFVTLSASRSNGISNQTQLLALFTFPFGSASAPSDTTLTFGAQSTRGEGQSSTYGTFDLQHSLPVGEGWGYYLHAQTDRSFTGGGSYYGPYGRYTVDGSSVNGSTALRGSVAGAVGIVGNHTFIAAPIEQSFAMVEVANIPGVRVLQENVEAGFTGSDGSLVLPRLTSYTTVNISIDPLTIPLDSTVGMTNQKVVTLGGTGILVAFESVKERNALIRLTLPDGAPLPAGAAARIAGQQETFPVALGGEVYVTGLGDRQDIVINYRGKSCRVLIALDRNSPPVADLGPFVCALNDARGEKP
jgi:outer membrane usher protein